MQWILPGTTLTAERQDADRVSEVFDTLFLTGGLTLSQVSRITGVEAYTVQNWVKRHFLSPPRGKRYDMEQVCRILNINILRGTMPLEQTVRLMGYLNGDLADEADDLVDDTQLYFFFVRLASRARYIGGDKTWDEALEEITREYREPVPGARDKLIRVLKIMLTVWVANRLKSEAEAMLSGLEKKI